jgi:hypothetical protein
VFRSNTKLRSQKPKFFLLPGARQALVAYWDDWLANLRERNGLSTYARYHNYDAADALLEFRRARWQAVFGA